MGGEIYENLPLPVPTPRHTSVAQRTGPSREIFPKTCERAKKLFRLPFRALRNNRQRGKSAQQLFLPPAWVRQGVMPWQSGSGEGFGVGIVGVLFWLSCGRKLNIWLFLNKHIRFSVMTSVCDLNNFCFWILYWIVDCNCFCPQSWSRWEKKSFYYYA